MLLTGVSLYPESFVSKKLYPESSVATLEETREFSIGYSCVNITYVIHYTWMPLVLHYLFWEGIWNNQVFAMCLLTEYLQISSSIESNTETSLVVLKKSDHGLHCYATILNFRKSYIAIIMLLQAQFSQLIFSPNRFGLLSLLQISESRGV